MANLRTCLLIAGFCFLSLSAVAQTQTTMNATANARYQEVDRRLNQVYQMILNQYRRDGVFIQHLKKAQRLWLQLRDADLRARYPNYGPGHSGSSQPMCESDQLTTLTEARIRQLHVWLTGVPEGELCAGSVKVVADRD